MSDQENPFELLRGLIAERRLKPGDRIPSIRELSRRFGASLVAVRDALVQAEREGLVEIRARSGAFVRAAERGDRPLFIASGVELRVVDGYQLHLCHAREILEVKMAGLAAARCRPADLLPVREALDAWLRGRRNDDFDGLIEADCRFHVGLARMAGNPVVANILDQCLQQQYMQEFMLIESRDDREEVIEVHTKIFEAVRDGDVKQARAMMRRHMKKLESLIHRLVLRTPQGHNADEAVEANGRRKS